MHTGGTLSSCRPIHTARTRGAATFVFGRFFVVFKGAVLYVEGTPSCLSMTPCYFDNSAAQAEGGKLVCRDKVKVVFGWCPS